MASHKAQLNFLRGALNPLCSSYTASCAVPCPAENPWWTHRVLAPNGMEAACLETEVWINGCCRSLLGSFFSTNRDWILIVVQIEIRSFIPFLKTWQEHLSLNTFIRQTEHFPNRNSREISKSRASTRLDLGLQSYWGTIRWTLVLAALSCRSKFFPIGKNSNSRWKAHLCGKEKC